MAYKRKRNVKIDNNGRYAIYKPNTLDVSSLEEYVPPSIDTGMEADEEKELHLKKIIEGGAGDIPIPVMMEVVNPAREEYGKYIPKGRYITWKEDAGNEYILDAEDKRFCKDSGIEEEEFSKSISIMSHEQSLENDTERKLVDVVVPKMLIRDEKFNFPAYVCFRKRIIKPNRRSRRSEELSKEKMERMWTELHILNILCELSSYKSKLESSLSEVELELFESAYLLMKNSNRRYRRRISRKILKVPGKSPKAAIVGPCGAIGDLMFDRFRIRSLRRRLYEIKQKKNLSEKETEIQALEKYNEVYKL